MQVGPYANPSETYPCVARPDMRFPYGLPIGHMRFPCGPPVGHVRILEYARRYFSLPFCAPATAAEGEHETAVGDTLMGDRRVATDYAVHFRVNKEWDELCERALTAKDIRAFETAVEQACREHEICCLI